MSSLVLELQRDALNPGTAVSHLLSLVFAAARKLKVDDLAAWAEAELKGYTGRPVPPYRIVTGEIRVPDNYHGSVPVTMHHYPGMAETLSRMPVDQPAGELETLLTSARPEDGFEIPYPERFEAFFVQQLGRRPTLHVARATIQGILDAVRQAALEWALKLEAEGIVGDGMTFTPQEQRAATAANVHIGNLIGSVVNSTVQQGTTHSQLTVSTSLDTAALNAALSTLLDRIPTIGIGGDELQQVQADIRSMQAQLSGPLPRRHVLQELWHSARTVLEHATAHVVGGATLHGLPELVSRVSTLLS